MYLIREYYSLSKRKIIFVFDTSAFIAKYHLQLPKYLVKIYTVKRVVEEVKDSESRVALELGIDTGFVNIVEPKEKYRDIVRKHAMRIGEYISLSKTDIDVAALALQLSREYDSKVIVVTDDYALQNLLYHLGVSFKPLRTMGIKKIHEYIVYCPNCGYVSSSGDEDVCPICGSKLVKKIVKSSSKEK
jgi:UPF0271 protein